MNLTFRNLRVLGLACLILAGCSSDNNSNNGTDTDNSNVADVGVDSTANNTNNADMKASVDTGNNVVKDTGEDVAADVESDIGKDTGPTDGCPEPVPNDDKATATPLALAVDATGVICGNEYDVFAIDLTAGTKITGTLSNTAFETENLDISLLNDAQADNIDVNNSVAFTFSFDMASESFDYDVPTTGTYYLVVFNNNVGDSDYTVNLSLQ